MNFAFTEEQEELRKAVRRFLEDKSPEAEVRRLMDTEEGYDAAVWSQMAQQLGLTGLAVPEELGGSGYGHLETTVVLEEMGRALLCAPYFSSVVMAANLLMSTDDEDAKRDFLPGIAGGSVIATVGLAEGDGRWDEAGVTLEAAGQADSWTLSGDKSFVLDGHVADLVLIVARAPSGISVFAVDSGAPGFMATRLETMDQTRKQAAIRLEGTPARLIGREGQGWGAVERMLQLAAVGLAAEQVGGAQFVLELSVQYAKDRIQFGRPIGSFQAVKHRCADMLLAVESAKSAAYYAGWVADYDPDELPIAASVAKSYCSEAYFGAAADTIQIHGGIGFTWEHPAHLYLKRAKSSELLLGDPVHHRAILADRLGI